MTKLQLLPGWDAALTYDLLDERRADGRADSPPEPVFVGREDLLGSLEDAISQPDRRGTYLISGYRGAGKSSLVIKAALLAKKRLAGKTFLARATKVATDQEPRWRLRRPKTARGQKRKKYELLPLVLNVSEVSASLESVDSPDSLPLGIDARRVLTALLRSLYQALDRLFTDQADDQRELVASVKEAYDKARAAQFSQTAQQRAESLRSREQQSRRSTEVANLLKVLASLAALGAVALEGVALLESSTAAIQVVCAALAGLAVFSYRTATTTQSKTSEEDSTRREVVFDNSLHQVETDLKDILSGFHERGIRTMFVLEELDKLKDEKGEQLDAVIRYFKNLFTQAPALFFFLTDKEYFDVIDGNIARSRHERKYAIEHTFFTHRIFVTRPSLKECLDYFAAVLQESDEARKAIQLIRDTTTARMRPWREMEPVERLLRVMLFNAQNHLFDLKSEMRRYVRVDDAGSRLEFDDESFPPQEQALAGFHFLLEQKARLFRFPGGRDYANELLRNSLASVFADMGDDAAHPVQALYTEAIGAGSPLTLAERDQIGQAVNSLLADLERGGAIDIDTPTGTAGEEAGSFYWRKNAVLAFSPSPKLEDHEEELLEKLARASRIAAQFGERGPLRSMAPGAEAHVEQVVARHTATEEEIRRAPRPLTREEFDQRSGGIVRDLAPLLAAARPRHQERLTARGWRLQPIRARSEGNVAIVTSPGSEDRPGRTLLVYGTESDLQQLVQNAVAAPTPAPIPAPTQPPFAVVLVDEDPQVDAEARDVLLSRWREALTAETDPSLVSVAHVTLGEGLDAASVDADWGERTADELAMAQLWLAEWSARLADPPLAASSLLPGSTVPVAAAAAPAWLGTSTGTELRYDSLSAAAAAWLAGGDRALAVPPLPVGDTASALAGAFVEASVTSNGPRLMAPHEAVGQIAIALPSETDANLLDARLRQDGRLISLHPEPFPDIEHLRDDLAHADARVVLLAASLNGTLGDVPIGTLRGDEPGGLTALARALDGYYPERATALYAQGADAGDTQAMAALIGRLRRAGDEAGVERWTAELIAAGDWNAVRVAAQDLDDPALTARLLEAAAKAGDTEAMALLVSRPGDPERSQRWEEQLVASQDWEAITHAGRDLADSDRALRLLEAAADAGHGDASSLLVASARFDDGVRDRWMSRLIASGGSYRLWDAARTLDSSDPERALTLHRAAADAGDPDSMVEVLVRCAASDPEASLENQARLAELEDKTYLERAADRLAEENPERAEELRALAATPAAT